jgi:hypothetical protein
VKLLWLVDGVIVMTTLSDLEDLLIENEHDSIPVFAANQWHPSVKVYAEELVGIEGIYQIVKTMKIIFCLNLYQISNLG